MNAFLSQFGYLSLVVSVGAYWFGVWLKNKTKKSWCNPLLIACVIVVGFLLATGLDYETYESGMTLANMLLTPAMICLAIPLYKQIQVLRRNAAAVLAGVLAGVLATFAAVAGCALLFRLTHVQYITLLPKSVTTAIGMALSEEMEGIVAVTVAAILVTGIFGNLTAPLILKLFRIRHPVAKGIAIGSSCHVIGTTRAMEMGEVEGAMSSLATVLSGLLTAFLVPMIAGLL